MPYAESRTQTPYVHGSYEVPVALLNATRVLYRVDPDEPVTNELYDTLRTAQFLADSRTEGTTNFWAQVLRVTDIPQKDVWRTPTSNTPMFRRISEILTTKETIEGDDPMELQYHLQPHSSEDYSSLQGLLLLLNDTDTEYADTESTVIIGTEVYASQQLHAYRDGREWLVTNDDDTTLHYVTARALACALVADEIDYAFSLDSDLNSSKDFSIIYLLRTLLELQLTNR